MSSATGKPQNIATPTCNWKKEVFVKLGIKTTLKVSPVSRATNAYIFRSHTIEAKFLQTYNSLLRVCL